MGGLTTAINRFLNSESNRMARRTDYNTGECRMKDTSASCFHYPTRFNREKAQIQDVNFVFDVSEEETISEDKMIVIPDVNVVVNGVEYSLIIKS